MSIDGMDVQEVRRMATGLREAGEELVTLEQDLSDRLAAVEWTGPDADQLREHWTGTLVPAITAASRRLTELGEAATRNADDQTATSAR